MRQAVSRKPSRLSLAALAGLSSRSPRSQHRPLPTVPSVSWWFQTAVLIQRMFRQWIRCVAW